MFLCRIVVLFLVCATCEASDPGPLSVSTFFGGSGGDGSWPVTCLAKGPAGNIYMTAKTYSANCPVTTGAYDETYNGNGDVIIAKFDPTLTTLLASTFLGGGGTDQSVAMVLDGAGNVYVAGETKSNNFPMPPGAYDPVKNKKQDIFIAKLDSSLTTLLGATYLGGDGVEYLGALALDKHGDLFISGSSESSGYPTTPGAYDETYNGGSPTWDYGDAVISKLDQNLSTLKASTFLGGAQGEYSCIFVLGQTGDLFLTGTTESPDFPTTPGAYDETFNGELDAYVSRLSPDLTSLLSSTVIGSNERDWGYCITLSDKDEIYIGGHGAAGYPTTPGAYDQTYNGGPYGDDDVILSKLDQNLSSLMASTFLGGNHFENCTSITLDKTGNVYVAGYSQSPDFPTTPGAFDEIPNGQEDAFTAKFTGALNGLEASTMLGGPNTDREIFVLYDNYGGVYVSGRTKSPSFPTTNGAYDTSHNGLNDVFISRLLLTGLYTNTLSLSSATGGTVDFNLIAGGANAHRSHLLLGSLSGTFPGLPLPGGQAILPLNWDAFTNLMLANLSSPIFTNFLGALDSFGNATARLAASPISGFIGVTMDFAYILDAPFDFVSNPATIEITP